MLPAVIRSLRGPRKLRGRKRVTGEAVLEIPGSPGESVVQVRWKGGRGLGAC